MPLEGETARSNPRTLLLLSRPSGNKTLAVLKQASTSLQTEVIQSHQFPLDPYTVHHFSTPCRERNPERPPRFHTHTTLTTNFATLQVNSSSITNHQRCPPINTDFIDPLRFPIAASDEGYRLHRHSPLLLLLTEFPAHAHPPSMELADYRTTLQGIGTPVSAQSLFLSNM